MPVRNLLKRFSARLLIRPLLVEGMLASVESSDEKKFRWTVLVDSETYPISESDISRESHERPLPSRLRNTIAHELVHSLAFRPAEFGIRLQRVDGKISSGELVAAIERETEMLSPLLLLSEKALAKLLGDKTEPLSLDELRSVRSSMGISRHVLINRLRLLGSADSRDFRSRVGLRNLAIGIAEWTEKGDAVLRNWPLFYNFDRNHVPAFLMKVTRQDRLPAKSVFINEAFAMCGGPHNTVDFVTDAGVEAVPNAQKFQVECSIETGNRKAGSECLYVVRRRGAPSPTEMH